MRKSKKSKSVNKITISILVALTVVISLAAYCIVNLFYGQNQGGGGIDVEPDGETPPVFENPPEITVTLSIPDSYLGDYPEAAFTVSNTGGSCTVSYTIFETTPQTESFSLGEGESETITVTGPQVRDIGTWSTSVQVTATNSYGSDFAQASTGFQINVEPLDSTPYINKEELQLAESNLPSIISYLLRAGGIIPSLAADVCLPLTWPLISPPTTMDGIAQELISRHPDDRDLQAKEIYYWVSNWIEYDYGAAELFFNQVKFPIQTINSRRGVCVNYALTAAVLYKAANFDVKLIALWDNPLPILDPRTHMAILLYLPSYGYHEPLNDGWISLDPTWGGPFGQSSGQHWNHYDTADV